MNFTLRLLTDDDIPALQRVYDLSPAPFTARFGHPASPDQAALDFVQALSEPGRYQFGILVDDALAGLADCKLDPGAAGEAHIGLLLLAPPYDDPDIAALALRILARWLAQTFHVHRLQTAIPANAPSELAFWQSEGFDFTGEQYRREMGEFAPRFLVLGRDVKVG